MSIDIDYFWSTWEYFWSILGPISFIFTLILLLYLHNPEKIEKITIHVSWTLSWISKQAEKKAISKEVKYLVLSSFRKKLCFRGGARDSY